MAERLKKSSSNLKGNLPFATLLFENEITLLRISSEIGRIYFHKNPVGGKFKDERINSDKF